MRPLHAFIIATLAQFMMAATLWGSGDSSRTDTRKTVTDRQSLSAAKLPLGIHKIRLEPGPDAERFASALLKFNLANEGTTALSDVVLEISVVDKPLGPTAHRTVRP